MTLALFRLVVVVAAGFTWWQYVHGACPFENAVVTLLLLVALSSAVSAREHR